MQSEIQDLLEEESSIDEMIEEMKRTRFGDGDEQERYERYGFVTRQDIAKVDS